MNGTHEAFYRLTRNILDYRCCSHRVDDEIAASNSAYTSASRRKSSMADRARTLRSYFEIKGIQEENRIVNFGNSIDSEYCDNYVKTSKYTIFNFLPRAIFEQFRRFGNQYFLMLVILMLLGTYTSLFESPIGPYTTLGPLVVVLAVSLAQEGYTDLKRHKSDDETNNRKTHVLNGNSEEVFWKNLRVGNIILVRNSSPLPADIILLATSEEENICYVETSQIDGETNLKLHRSPGSLFSPEENNYFEQVVHSIGDITGTIECEPPNLSINTFTGVLRLPYKPDPLPLGPENLLLRGSSLRNTHWAIGVVVYSGLDTKIMKNSRQVPSKLSRIDKAINAAIVLIFVSDLVLVTISAALLLLWEKSNFSQAMYLGYYLEGESDLNEFDRYDGGMNWQTSKTSYGVGWATFLILYNNFIPISMYVTVEIVVFMLLGFVNSDIYLYDSEKDMPAKARSSNITDLGQIQYVFSDKTGTLTQNIMKFKRASCDGLVYGAPTDDSSSVENEHSERSIKNFRNLSDLRDLAVSGNFCASCFLDILSMAHTVVVEKKEHPAKGIIYQAESPDEGALVDAAKELGYELLGRNSSTISVEIESECRVLEVLAVNKFDSDRKRMSVLVKLKDGTIRLLCKGADSSMLGSEQAVGLNDPQILALQDHLQEFACEGLRTLVLGVRDLSQHEFDSWYSEYKAAQEALVKRSERLTAAATMIERNMTIVGATAIEDKLQDGVPDTIASLAYAGIKLWVLTGDKRETAINIGFSSKVLTPEMSIRSLINAPKIEVRRQLASLYKDMVLNKSKVSANREKGGFSLAQYYKIPSCLGKKGRLEQDLKACMEEILSSPLTEGYSPPAKTAEQSNEYEPAFIMEGPALLSVFGDVLMEAMLFQVASQCNAVIACRVSPKQKAILVKMVKQYVKPTPVTLSIGDGANDVPMLQEAQVGVGISGKEGQQAVNNSDFAIAQFRYLKDLLLVHGRWNYRRLSKVVLYSFFKNFVLVVCLFLFNFQTGFSGTPIFEDNLIALYNFFLALPIIAIGVFDKDVTREFALKHPELYYIGRESKDLNGGVVLIWIVYAIISGLLTYYIPYFTFATNFATIGEIDMWGLRAFSTIVFAILIIAMNYKVLLETRTITYCQKGLCGSTCNKIRNSAVSDSESTHIDSWPSKFGWTVFIWVGSIVFYFVVVLVYSVLPSIAWNYYYAGIQAYSSGIMWHMLLLVPTAIILLDIGAKFSMQQFCPSLTTRAIEENEILEKNSTKTYKNDQNPSKETRPEVLSLSEV